MAEKFPLGTPLNENLGVSWNYSIYNQGRRLDPSLGTVVAADPAGGGRGRILGVVDRQ